MSLRIPQSDPQGELSSPLGRYGIHQAIAVGEITSVHIGLLEGAEGFRKTVAIKRLIAGLVHEQAALAELTYEACVGAIIHHPNVVSVIDLGQVENGPFLVMEYVLGETVAGLLRASGRCPVPIAVAIVGDTLRGLHAAHIAEDATGGPLEIVHRNVCPENILVGVDGMARLIDFGASVSALDSMTIPNRIRWTQRAGVMSPEQVMGWPVDGRADVFAAGVTLWELVAGVRPFRNHGAHQAFLRRPARSIPPASAFNMDVSPAVEAVMERALSWSPSRRFETAIHFAEELEAAVPPATRAEVAAWVESTAATRLAVQRKLLSAMDAPYGRISSPPPNARRFELRHTDPIASPRRSSSPPPPRKEKKFGLGISALRSTIGGAFRKTAWPALPAPEVGRWFSGSVVRAKDALAQQGSTVLATLSLLCLLLAATRATISRAHPAAIQAGAPMAVLPAGTPRVAGAAFAPIAEDECLPAPLASPSPAPEPAPRIATLIPGAPPEPVRRDTSDERERRGRTPKRSAGGERANCDPPFLVDESGIRRIKPNCL